MARLGVDELLADPDFASEVIVHRRTQTVDALGRAVYVDTPEVIIAVVQPVETRNDILPDGTRAPAKIEIVTQARLRAATDLSPADQIDYAGARWAVVVVSKWAQWGEGHYEATAERIGLLDNDT